MILDLVDLFDALQTQFYGGPTTTSTGEQDDDETDARIAGEMMAECYAVPD